LKAVELKTFQVLDFILFVDPLILLELTTEKQVDLVTELKNLRAKNEKKKTRKKNN
jgi:hypothetical protein